MESFVDPSKIEEEARRQQDVPKQDVARKKEALSTEYGQGNVADMPAASVNKPASFKPGTSTASISTVLKPPDEAIPFPQLSHHPPSPHLMADDTVEAGEEDFRQPDRLDRSLSPAMTHERKRGAMIGKVVDNGVSRMHKFSLYETATYFYIIGSDLLDSKYRILKIDRTSDHGQLDLVEEDTVYTKQEKNQILQAVDEGNKSTGGLKLKVAFFGLLGFIRFTGPYYMLVITKKSPVAMIGGHYVHQIDGTELIPLTVGAYGRAKAEKSPDEARFVGILNGLDLSRSFYYSYSYDVTRSLQQNIMRERKALQEGRSNPGPHDYNDMFVWNHHLLEPAKAALRNPHDWCLSIVHGYIDQAALSIYWGRVVYVTIIARRSRFFAGARFLKRGANDLGYVANDVETEQIVSEMLTTSFHAPGPILFANSNYTSHVQHRGSIPLFWTQDGTGVSPKPDIKISVVDPFFSAAALHFDNLFHRYGTPIYVLNLVKARERTPRESKLLNEYTNSINYLNQFLPADKRILYRAFDMSRASKSRDQDVIGSLEDIADDILPKTGFFRNGNDEASGLQLQRGVTRTNCVDCLDRTNAAQFVIAKKAFGLQLQALGVIEEPHVEYDSDAVNLFTHMWHDHGDTIAVQYGGSHLVNTMATYRKINQWTSHSRDMVESFKRYYNNSFMDAQRQEAYNLFLGNYTFVPGQPMLWELSSDYYLHHADPRSVFSKRRPSYRHWFTQDHLKSADTASPLCPQGSLQKPLQFFDDYWVEYYRPLALSSFQKIFSFQMHSNLRYILNRSTQHGTYDLSPFKVRHIGDSDAPAPSKTSPRKGVRIIAPLSDDTSITGPSSIDTRLSSPLLEMAPKPITLGPWLDAQQQLHNSSRRQTQHTGIIKESSFEASSNYPSIPPMPMTTSTGITLPTITTKADLALEAFTRQVANSLDPSVPDEAEYHRYVRHPMNIALVASEPIDAAAAGGAPRDFVEYLSKTQDLGIDGVVAGDGVAERAEASLDDYVDFLEVREEGLTVLEEDGAKKRYKAYRKWLRGKSLFKQSLVSSEAV